MTAALAAGAALGAYGIAGAATSTTTKAPSSGSNAPKFHSNEDPAHEKGESAQREADENSGKFDFRGGPGHCDHGGKETAVTGAVAAKIKAAALKAVPGATVTKTEKRDDGTYEAELKKSDGTEEHLSLDKNFKVLARRGPGPDMGRGMWQGRGGRGGWRGYFGGGGAPTGAPGAPSA